MSKVIIFTDGACSGNPGPGGWGSILISPLGKIMELGGHESKTTNNRMELTAALEALLALSRVKTLTTKEISLYTDSKYIINGITAWVFGWKKNGWKTADGKDVSNRELWEKLLLAVQENQFKIDWLYVPGHMGFPGNERCDEIAVAFSHGETPTLYQGAKNSYKIDVEHLPSSSKESPLSSGIKKKKGSPIYLSYIDGVLHRDKDWKTCEARVKGRPSAKYKKVESQEEETEFLKKWGI